MDKDQGEIGYRGLFNVALEKIMCGRCRSDALLSYAPSHPELKDTTTLETRGHPSQELVGNFIDMNATEGAWMYMTFKISRN